MKKSDIKIGSEYAASRRNDWPRRDDILCTGIFTFCRSAQYCDTLIVFAFRKGCQSAYYLDLDVDLIGPVVQFHSCRRIAKFGQPLRLEVRLNQLSTHS